MTSSLQIIREVEHAKQRGGGVHGGVPRRGQRGQQGAAGRAALPRAVLPALLAARPRRALRVQVPRARECKMILFVNFPIVRNCQNLKYRRARVHMRIKLVLQLLRVKGDYHGPSIFSVSTITCSRLLCTIIYSVVSRASDPLITILYLYLSIFIFSDQRSRQKYSKDHIRKTISSVVVSTHELAWRLARSYQERVGSVHIEWDSEDSAAQPQRDARQLLHPCLYQKK